MNKTLIIHIDDPTTAFMKKVYEGTKATVLNSYVPVDEMNSLLEEHDRIIMIGHGNPKGLFSHPMSLLRDNNYEGDGYIISDKNVEVLSTKKDCVYLWCDADRFIIDNQLTGFYSGMYISELGEARILQIDEATEQQMDEANEALITAFKDVDTKSAQQLSIDLRQNLSRLADTNPIAAYNLRKVFYCEEPPSKPLSPYTIMGLTRKFENEFKCFLNDYYENSRTYSVLMTLVEIIEGNGFWVDINGCYVRIGLTGTTDSFINIHPQNKTKPEAIYTALTKFLEWYKWQNSPDKNEENTVNISEDIHN